MEFSVEVHGTFSIQCIDGGFRAQYEACDLSYAILAPKYSLQNFKTQHLKRKKHSDTILERRIRIRCVDEEKIRTY